MIETSKHHFVIYENNFNLNDAQCICPEFRIRIKRKLLEAIIVYGSVILHQLTRY